MSRKVCPLSCKLVAFLFVALGSVSYASGPTITVWYGTNQSFGHLGNPQEAINILGNVSDSNGIQSLTYRLNGGAPVALSRGPDTRRLLRPGDFNADINTENLLPGTNTVVITATNTLNEASAETITVNYTAGNIWPPTYTVDWSQASSIPSVAQVVDGHWTLTDSTIRPTYLGYDRLVAIGDKNWTDYEVTVPIIFYSLDTLGGFGNPSNGPGVGLLFRWTGHTDNPIPGWQPKTGYLPLGAIAWYHWNWIDPNVPPQLELLGNNLNSMGSAGSILTSHVWYYFKMRVQTIHGVGGAYKLKVWQVDQPEPSSWLIEGQQTLSDPQNGSFLLISHHVDAEFGNVTVTQLGSPLPVQLASFTATVQNIRAVRLDWMTLSETNNYGFEVQKALQHTHSFVTIPNSFIPGHGTTSEPHFYTFIDTTASLGVWLYRLKQIDLDGTFHYSEPIEASVMTNVAEAALPNTFALEQNYPNPFNSSTTITFHLPNFERQPHVTLKVFDMLGREIATLVNELKLPGEYTVTWDATNIPSGVYVSRLSVAGRSLSQRMILLK